MLADRLIARYNQEALEQDQQFHRLLNKIQERNYVNRENVEGKKLTIIDYLLEQGKDDIILENSEANANSLVRRIDETLSIRKGKYGDYIFYKTEKNEETTIFET